MSNMSYVRFENTYSDLVDCCENMEKANSDREIEYRKKLVELCKGIAEKYADEYGDN